MKCKACRCAFEPVRPMQSACSLLCAQDIARHKREQAETKARQEERRADRAKREELKTIPQLKKEAQVAFNRFIRLRDRGLNCICCGRLLDYGRIGGAVDAGHFRSTGSADHLRFNEDNCHAQRSDCNQYGAGRAIDYRAGLVGRIGSDRLVALENDQHFQKWTKDGLRETKALYRAKGNELEKQYDPFDR